jgi:hypothetical protein
MGAKVTWLIGQIRFGRDFNTYGDPYDGVATLENRGGGVGVISGLAGEATAKLRAEVLDAIAAEGFSEAHVERHSRWFKYLLDRRPFKRVRI